MAGRTWVWRSLLRFWLRGQGDCPQNQHADFGYLAADQERFLAALPACFAAGFIPYSVFMNSQRQPVRYVLYKDSQRFQFYRFDSESGPGAANVRYWLHAPMPVEGGSIEFVGQLPLAGWTTWPALDRLWRVPAPPAAWLTALYGDWRAPAPKRSHLPRDRCIIQRRFWQGEGSPERMFPPGAPGFASW
jgi:hypothetical protein